MDDSIRENVIIALNSLSENLDDFFKMGLKQYNYSKYY